MKKQSNQKPPFIAMVIMLCILFSILSYIWEKFHTIIIIAAILAVVLFIGYIISVLEKNKNDKIKYSSANSSNAHMPQELKNETIKRQMDILFESTELMNNSNSLGTVINRINMACNTIDKLSTYTYEELVAAGYSPKDPLSNTKDYIQKNRVTIINQAIERNLKHEIESLKTTRGKINKLDKIYSEIKENTFLEADNLMFLNELYNTTKKDLADSPLDATSNTADTLPEIKLSPIEAENIPQHISFNCSETNGWETWSQKQILDTFYKLSERITRGKEVLPKIEACENSYRILKPVIKIFSEDPAGLPPLISCRDYGPHLYQKLGNWEDAERAIWICMDAGAYESPDDGENAIEYLMIYKKVAETAMNFIRENPAFLQKNIYTALRQQIGDENIPVLKDFMRETYVFHKQPRNGTNELYLIERK